MRSIGVAQQCNLFCSLSSARRLLTTLSKAKSSVKLLESGHPPYMSTARGPMGFVRFSSISNFVSSPHALQLNSPLCHNHGRFSNFFHNRSVRLTVSFVSGRFRSVCFSFRSFRLGTAPDIFYRKRPEGSNRNGYLPVTHRLEPLNNRSCRFLTVKNAHQPFKPLVNRSF